MQIYAQVYIQLKFKFKTNSWFILEKKKVTEIYTIKQTCMSYPNTEGKAFVTQRL